MSYHYPEKPIVTIYHNTNISSYRSVFLVTIIKVFLILINQRQSPAIRPKGFIAFPLVPSTRADIKPHAPRNL